MLSILPKFEQMEHKAELIFVIDRSGSMGGDGIKQAKKAWLVIIPFGNFFGVNTIKILTRITDLLLSNK